MKLMHDKRAKVGTGEPTTVGAYLEFRCSSDKHSSEVSFFVLVYLYMSSASFYFNEHFVLGCI
jgi:hypothetical protein